MAAFMFLKERRPSIVEPLVSFGDLTTAFRDALASQNLSQSHWIGPTPRVTRRGGLTERFSVRVAWPIEVLLTDASLASGVTLEGHARDIARAIDQKIASLGEGWRDEWNDTVVTPYSVPLNGPLTFWDGQASRTLTMDRASTASDARAENPIGPDDAGTRVGGAPGSETQTDKIVSAVKFVAVAAVVLGAVYAVGQFTPALTLWSARRSSESSARRELAATRPNPRSRKRR